ncbi:hypothetical protein FKW77_000806 [Venturia effusa]|uniref:Uncharacterized protein n=1 Tax=Venturia effusa TaxID=50376 RepID=A0A517LGF4_9PEZI|nr:hypothetical protein FKW77_000806 [Venturia effusa]
MDLDLIFGLAIFTLSNQGLGDHSTTDTDGLFECRQHGSQFAHDNAFRLSYRLFWITETHLDCYESDSRSIEIQSRHLTESVISASRIDEEKLLAQSWEDHKGTGYIF